MKNNRLGIVLIVSSLLVIAIVMGLLLLRQQNARADQVRVQGVGMTRSLTTLPLSILAPTNGRASVLHSLLISYENADFAYAAVTGLDGVILAQATSPGTLVPGIPLPAGTTSLYGERMIAGRPEQGSIREFFGPIMEDGSLKAFVRIGYLESRGLLNMRDLPFFALLALAMFLLVPLIYFLFKREIAPLGAISRQLQAISESGTAAPQAGSTPDVRALADRLNRYLEVATARIQLLEHDSMQTVANGRLLEYGNNKMTAVLQCLPDGLMILDPSGDITFANGKIEPLLGVDLQQVLSAPIDAWCHDPDLRTLFARYSGDSAESGRQITIEFASARMPDKRLMATAQPLVGGLGTMIFGTLIVVRDVTREHLGQQAGNDFVAHVSHELKSPLNVIGMYTEMLRGAGAADEGLRVEAFNVIQDELERMNALVGNLLNVSKLEMGSMSPERQRVRLGDLLQDVFDHAASSAENKSMQMRLQVARELPAVTIDKELFRIALNNLMTNAVKYSNVGGSVTLSAVEADNDIIITVRDSGIGISAADQPHVFEKFYRAADGAATRSGHGLGLYLSNQIVGLHHGHISLDSSPGQGSAFSIHLKKMSMTSQGSNLL